MGRLNISSKLISLLSFNPLCFLDEVNDVEDQPKGFL